MAIALLNPDMNRKIILTRSGHRFIRDATYSHLPYDEARHLEPRGTLATLRERALVWLVKLRLVRHL